MAGDPGGIQATEDPYRAADTHHANLALSAGQISYFSCKPDQSPGDALFTRHFSELMRL
jgi:hypothetical protein